MTLALLAIFGVLLLGLIVFGGGQVFMPLFKALWEIMDKNGAHISEDKINNIFAVSNATPGVVSTKFGFFTGYLVSNGQWWGYLAMIGTYLIFALPSIILILVTTKMIRKSKTNKYLKNTIIFLRPIIIGVLLALSIQLLMGTMFPQIYFNSYSKGYIPGIDSGGRSHFFSGWRMWTLMIWTPISIMFSIFWLKRKYPLLMLIIIFVVLALLIFAPWVA
ncbi:chromate transporter [Mycoplasma marinum]|uniref:Chromate transporter n=1 Tax=Mycoplasma marinum TaxID=1937190 RepID=A0A4R0XKD3_9MOLU|nr:chromate transporter [Mycoplasma marinum]TCG10914.1 chromate transporter [Mycoplasma marinum]